MGKKLWSFLTICMFTVSMAFAQQKVTGVVIDAETSEPVVGASVRVKGANIGAATNIEGKFTLEAPSSSSTLVVSYIGMKTKEVAIKPNVRIVLESESNNLSDVVVVAYGTQKRESLTGAMAIVDSKVIDQHIATSATAALEGSAPGIQVNNTYGEPGSSPKIRIRGFSTINGSNDPLYVVDGAVFEGNISEINSADIETFNILKDAASAALYGNRAANGVVLITTKKGKGGSTPNLSLRVNHGFYTRGIPEYDVMNAKQWMEQAWTAMKNDAMNGTMALSEDKAKEYATEHLIGDYVRVNIFDKPEDQLFDANGKLVANMLPGYADDLDWEKNIERVGHRQDYTLSGGISGEKFNVYSSVGYLKENGYAIATDYERYTARINTEFRPKKWITTGLNLSGTHGKMNYNGSAEGSYYANPFYIARNMAPVYSYYEHDKDGNLVYDEDGNPAYNFASYLGNRNIAYERRQDTQDNRRNVLSAMAFATINLPYDFSLTVKGSTDWSNSNRTRYNNPNVGDGATNNGRFTASAYEYHTYTFQQLLNWNKSYDVHNITALIGHENYSYEREYTTGMMTDMAVSGLLVLGNFQKYSYYYGYDDVDRTESYLGKVTYNYDEKYFADFSFRRDGTSRLKKNRWGNFYSVGAAWNMKRESFLEDVDVVSSLRLHTAYGEVGSLAGLSSYYPTMALYEIDKNGGKPAFIKKQLAAEDLKWETTRTFDIGVDARLFDMVNFSASYFKKRNVDLLFAVRKPLSAGGYAHDEDYSNMTQYRNIGVMETNGLELAVDVDVINSKDWKWNVGADATFATTKVIKLPDGKDIRHGQQLYSEGHPIYAWHTYHWVGVDQMTGKSIYTLDPEKKADAVKAGKLVTINEVDYTLDTSYGLRDFCGSATPTVYGAFRSNLSWKNLSMNVLLTYSLGGKCMDYSYQNLMSCNSASSASQFHKDAANSWNGAPEGMTETSPNRISSDVTPIFDFSSSSDNNATSDRWLTSSSYLVFKNITLSYSLPKNICSMAGISGVSFNAGVENLFTITARKGLNPQYNFSGGNDDTYVTARVWNIGLVLNF